MAVEKANEAKTLSMEENKENTTDEGIALESILPEERPGFVNVCKSLPQLSF